MSSKILVTGGTGYIGSHTVVELQKAGHEVVIIDNLSNSKKEVIDKIAQITGKTPTFHKVDLLDAKALDGVFAKYKFEAVIHFAGLKAVGESISQPLKYYQNNITGTLNLLESMKKHKVKNLVFSSSATVYGTPETLPITEDSQVGIGITNPYGWTKYMIERILQDQASSDETFSVTTLRYFNPIGAHESGLLGESPTGEPNNIAPYIARVAQGWLPEVRVFGDDYDTPDGTGVRDYINVVDLAKAHLAALEHIAPGFQAYTLGTGTGTSVLELIESYKTASGHEIPYSITVRRPGDIATMFTAVDKAKQNLNWTSQTPIQKSLEDDWRWRQNETK